MTWARSSFGGPLKIPTYYKADNVRWATPTGNMNEKYCLLIPSTQSIYEALFKRNT